MRLAHEGALFVDKGLEGKCNGARVGWLLLAGSVGAGLMSSEDEFPTLGLPIRKKEAVGSKQQAKSVYQPPLPFPTARIECP